MQMNYVSVLLIAVALFAIIYWYVAGRFYYIGPRVKAQLIEGVTGDELKKNSSPGNSSDGNHPGELRGSEPVAELKGSRGGAEMDGTGTTPEIAESGKP